MDLHIIPESEYDWHIPEVGCRCGPSMQVVWGGSVVTHYEQQPMLFYQQWLIINPAILELKQSK